MQSCGNRWGRDDLKNYKFFVYLTLRWGRTASSVCSCQPIPWTQSPPPTCCSASRSFPKTWPKREWWCSKCSRYKSWFSHLGSLWNMCFHILKVITFAPQKLQVPNIPISKCAACLKPPVSEEDKLKRCTRCYRVGYCNQYVYRKWLIKYVMVIPVSCSKLNLFSPFPLFQSVSENPLAQSQKSLPTQHGERGPAFPGQCARVSTLIRSPRPASGGLFQVQSILFGRRHIRFVIIRFAVMSELVTNFSRVKSTNVFNEVKLVPAKQTLHVFKRHVMLVIMLPAVFFLCRSCLLVSSCILYVYL